MSRPNVRTSSRPRFTLFLAAACGLGAGADDPPTPGAPAERPKGTVAAAATPPAPPSPDASVHEGERSPVAGAVVEHVEKAPPRLVSERPGARPPGPDHQWVEGYWDWDKARGAYVWVAGTWREAPPDSFWVSGYWRRDDKGWFRVPGFWSGRPGARKGEWRKEGPPTDRPAESVGRAPGPDYFFVRGHYAPRGDEVVWKPGHWSRSQPGWEWVPARWSKEGVGWAFQEGRWSRKARGGETKAAAPGGPGAR